MTSACVASRSAALALVLSAGPVAAFAAEGWRVTLGEITVAVPLRPGGGFEARTSSLHGSLRLGAQAAPLPVTGTLSVDLRTIETGISLRDRHLRENYLEVERGEGFDTAELTELRLLDATGTGFQGRTGFVAMLRLHDTRKQVAGTAELRQTDTDVRVDASFPLVLTDFGIQPPQYMGVGVGDRLLVRAVFVATQEKAP